MANYLFSKENTALLTFNGVLTKSFANYLFPFLRSSRNPGQDANCLKYGCYVYLELWIELYLDGARNIVRASLHAGVRDLKCMSQIQTKNIFINLDLGNKQFMNVKKILGPEKHVVIKIKKLNI